MTSIPDATVPRLATKARLKWDEVRQEHLLLFPEGVLVLNPTAHEIIGLCDGHNTVRSIRETLSTRYKTDAVSADLQDLLHRLAQKRLMILEVEL
jgi:pyrroloquinoline quinone biosynthesis protein D